MKALNFGSMNLDYVYQVEHFVQPGETISALSQTVNPGGKGLNQSIALARAGAEVWHGGCAGQGGEPLVQLLRESGVHTDLIRTADAIQGNAVIQVNRDGQNCILLFGGSNQCITEKQIRETLSGFGEGDCLILQNEVNQLAQIVDTAFEKGMTIVMNPSPYDEKLSSIDFGKISWLLVNEVEAAQLSGSEDPQEAWKLLHGRYPHMRVLITLGSAGSMVFTGDETFRQDAFRVKAVDTTAAGDTFTGYFVAGLMRGLPIPECMKQASMASAISVTRPGAAPSIPERAEVMDALVSCS